PAAPPMVVSGVASFSELPGLLSRMLLVAAVIAGPFPVFLEELHPQKIDAVPRKRTKAVGPESV
ncbi:MAG: hypothetical protein HGA97_10900, partial [Chlorobiaceae bacterium]|nr:hypothetical protein [Chlorobiaceae bacterium]